MEAHLEKGKEILWNKHFCFMKWQEDDVKARGEEVMTKEDIEYLLSLKDLEKDKFLDFDATEKGFFSDEDMEKYEKGFLFQYIKRAKKEGYAGLSIWGQDPTIPEEKSLKKQGYFTYPEYPGMKLYMIYFSEESFIKAKIAKFQAIFGNIREMHSSNII